MRVGVSLWAAMGIMGVGKAGGAAGVTVFQATSYMHRSGCKLEHLDKVSALCRNNAAKNPYAHLKQPGITPEDVAKTPMVIYPLRFGHICPRSDGACAMIFTTEEKARKMCDRPAWIKSCASGSDECSVIGLFGAGFANVDPSEQRGCKVAAKKAYKLAGISNPEKEIDLTEIYQPFSSQHLLFYERLFLCKEGGAPKALDDGVMEIDGDLPADPSGGTLCTNAIGASAMERVAYCALQIMGKAGDFQVPKDVHNAVAHGWGGSVNLITVTVLGDTPRKR
jgi:acetyl-CoA C-acetyltransferase